MSVSDDLSQRSIEDWSPDDSAEKEYLSDFVRLPGMWEVRDKCLEKKPLGFCEHGHVQVVSESSCKRRDCPKHWYLWRKPAVEKIVARLAAYRYTQEGRGKRLLHLVDSPDQSGRWTTNRLWNERSQTYDVVEEQGGRGGLCVPHAYKPTDEARAIFAQAVENGVDPEIGIWRFLRRVTDDWEELRSLIEVAPHNHTLSMCEDLDGEEIKESLPDGRVLHNIRSLKPLFVYEDEVDPYYLLDDSGRIVKDRREVVEDGFEDMARLAMYLLSHSAVQVGVGDSISQRNTVTWFGEVHPNSFDPGEELDPAVWARIQKLAEDVVGETPEEPEDDDGGLTRECNREDCEAVVRPTSELSEYLSNVREYEGWFDGLDFEQKCEIWGLWTWLGDTPPPGRAVSAFDGDGEKHELPPGGFERSPETPDAIKTDGESVVEWLRRVGRQRLHRKPGYSNIDAGSVSG